MGRRKDESANAKLCEQLYVLADYERLMTKNKYKANAYRQAAAVLAKHPLKIKSGDEAKKLGKIGPSIAELIDEFISTGKIEKVEEIKEDEEFNAVVALTQIPGIGPAKARDLVEKGARTIEDLRLFETELNHHQLIGLKYFDDFKQKIPRYEIEGMERILIEKLAAIDGKFIVTICGSYRRGKAMCSDVVCLVTHPKYASETCVEEDDISIRKIVSKLKKADLIVDTIALTTTKFMGVAKMNSRKPARRFDIRLIPNDRYFCAILSFTGSDTFNQNIRAHALANGFILNESTLRPIDPASDEPGEPIPLTSERQIFDILNYPYKPPSERDT